jgi:hypothetical protein
MEDGFCLQRQCRHEFCDSVHLLPRLLIQVASLTELRLGKIERRNAISINTYNLHRVKR